MKYGKVAAALAVGTVMTASAAMAATVTENATGFSLGDDGRTLVTMTNLNLPGVATGVAITNAAGGGSLAISALAYRPQTGQTYGYSNQNNTVYLIDTMSGVATAQATSADGTDVETLGFDFNNQVDAARIVTTGDTNLVYFPNNTPQNVARFTDLFYGMGDANEGNDPEIIGNAYTNAVPNASTTLQFGLDSQQDTLVTIANNAGTLATVGDLFLNGDPFNINTDGGFDILSFSEGDNTAIALLSSNSIAFNGQGLFTIPLIADALGRINVELIGATTLQFGALDGFAVAPGVTPVPLPASLGFLLGGVALMGFMGRKRRKHA